MSAKPVSLQRKKRRDSLFFKKRFQNLLKKIGNKSISKHKKELKTEVYLPEIGLRVANNLAERLYSGRGMESR